MYSTGSIRVFLVGAYLYSIILSAAGLHIAAGSTSSPATDTITHEEPLITENSTLVTTEEPEDDEAGGVVTILPGKENDTDIGVNRTLSQRVILYEHFNGTGPYESLNLVSGQCRPVPQLWLGDRGGHSVAAVRYDGLCLRFWERNECSGRTRCYCDPELLSLDQSYPMSNETLWFGNLKGLSTCFLENDTFSRVLLFSEPQYQGEDSSLILAPKECVTFYRGDKWQDKVKSLIVTDGCVEYFTQEECRGDNGGKLEYGETIVGEKWEGQLRSFRNCARRTLSSDDN